MRIFDNDTREEVFDPDFTIGEIIGEVDWIVDTDGTPEGDVWERVQLYHAWTPEEIAQREEAEEQAEQQELINALPDAVADLSEMVSDNTIDTADLQDALAELSEIVSGLME